MYPNDFYKPGVNECASYNGEFDAVTTGALRPDGFEMSGAATATMNIDGTVNNVSINLTRVVAKVAVQIDIDPTFTERHHGGVMRVSSIFLTSEVLVVPWLFDNYNGRTINHEAYHTHLQYPALIDGKYCALFYLFEQAPAALGENNKVTMTIQTRYSQDGNFQNGGNIISHQYKVDLEGSGDGEIKRNGYYRITGTITDFDALHTRSAVEVSEWEVPVTNDVGNLTRGR
jgi:hypothetical protein